MLPICHRSSSPTSPVRLNLSAMVQCFSLTTNQPIIPFSMAFQRNEQGNLLEQYFLAWLRGGGNPTCNHHPRVIFLDLFSRTYSIVIYNWHISPGIYRTTRTDQGHPGQLLIATSHLVWRLWLTRQFDTLFQNKPTSGEVPRQEGVTLTVHQESWLQAMH